MILGRMATVSFGIPEGDEDEMPAPVTEQQPTEAERLQRLRADILNAKAALEGARAAWKHSPNRDTAYTCVLTEARLNRLVEQHPREEAS